VSLEPLDEAVRKIAREPEAWDPGEFADLLSSVVDETGENLDILGRDLLTLEKEGSTPELVNRCFRAAHNLKGLSHVIVIHKLTLIAREMENLLEELRKGQRPASPPLIDVLLKAVDAIREGILPHMQQKTPIQSDFTSIVEALIAERERKGDAAAPVSPPAVPVSPSAAPVPPPAAPSPAPAFPPAAMAAKASSSAPEPAQPPSGPLETAPAAAVLNQTRIQARAQDVAARQEDRILRVGLNKLDDLMNQVGELVIGKTRFEVSVVNLRNLRGELSLFKTHLDELSRRRKDEQKYSALASEIDNLLWKHSLAGTERPDWTRLRQEIADLAESHRIGIEQGSLRAQVSELRDEVDRVNRAYDELIRDLEESLDYMGLVSDQLQTEVMKVRMVPISQLFNKFPRMVRDLCRKLGKEAEVTMSGSETELDKLLVDLISEPLMHVVRNSLDHGLEPPEERTRLGKPPVGEIHMGADHKGGEVHIEVGDDGSGIDPTRVKRVAVERGILEPEEAAAMTDEQAIDLIFKPGFSTAAAITDVSGRGVGMDVVREAISTLKGAISVDTAVGKGTTVRIRLPLTLAIINAILVMKNNEVFAIPLTSVLEMLTIQPREIRTVGTRQMVNCRGETLFIRWLDDILGIEGTTWEERTSVPVVVIGNERARLGIAVDKLLGRQEIVIKSLGGLLRRVRCTLGSTILGDGRAILILDPYDILEYVEHSSGAPVRPSRAAASVAPAPGEDSRPAVSILLVDDSRSIRSKMREYLIAAGFKVVEAEDGAQALEIAQRERFDLVSTDINMPHMDGYDLTRSLRKLPEYRRTPIVMVSSKSEKMDRIRGFDAGADDYLVKPFNRDTLLNTIRNNLRL